MSVARIKLSEEGISMFLVHAKPTADLGRYAEPTIVRRRAPLQKF